MAATVERTILPGNSFWQVVDDTVAFTFALNRGRFVLIVPVAAAGATRRVFVI